MILTAVGLYFVFFYLISQNNCAQWWHVSRYQKNNIYNLWRAKKRQVLHIKYGYKWTIIISANKLESLIFMCNTLLD